MSQSREYVLKNLLSTAILMQIIYKNKFLTVDSCEYLFIYVSIKGRASASRLKELRFESCAVV